MRMNDTLKIQSRAKREGCTESKGKGEIEWGKLYNIKGHENNYRGKQKGGDGQCLNFKLIITGSEKGKQIYTVEHRILYYPT